MLSKAGPARLFVGLAAGAGAALAGALAALAFAPWHWLPLHVVGMSALFWLLSRSPRSRTAFFLGWCYGLGYFLVAIQWIGYAFLVDPEKFAWMMPFAVTGLAALLAVFPAIGCGLARWLGRGPTGLVIALTGLWAVMEWLRGTVLTGFPWHHPAYLWTASDATLQGAALFGPQLLGLIAVAASIAPGYWLALPRAGRRPALLWLGLTWLVVAATWGWGAWRLADAPPLAETATRLRIVQAGIPQAEKWQPELRERNLQLYLGLSAEPAELPPTLLIWPETATSFLLLEDPERQRQIAAALPPGSLLITGTPRRAPDPAGIRYFNSAATLSAAGTAGLLYDKRHLVPFGEFLPLRPVLAVFGFDKLAAGPVDFSAGPHAGLLAVPGLPPLRLLICYEALFPGEVRADGRPGWLLNLTNDAWFGDSAGPRQHLAIARMRAVELGVPLVRAANTGISAVTDPYGRLLGELGLGVSGILDAALPARLASPPPFLVIGNTPFALVVALLLLAAVKQRNFLRKIAAGGKA